MLVRKIWEDVEVERPEEKLLVDRSEAETIALGYVSVEKENSTHLGYHDDEEEIYIILKGKALLKLGSEEVEVGPGSVAYVPRNTEHQMTCISDEKLEYLYFANWPDKK
jgi:mannose-6-phosphate isomerase-like protein (cupin superfamily)